MRNKIRVTRRSFNEIRNANYKQALCNAKTFSTNVNEFWVMSSDRQFFYKQSKMSPGRKYDDYVAAVYIGAILRDAPKGGDAFVQDRKGLVEEVELKLCLKSKDSFELGPQGGLYQRRMTSAPKPKNFKPKGFYSSFTASYEIVNNLLGKNMPTYMVVMDDDTWELVCALRMEGTDVVRLLGTRNSQKRKLNFNDFETHGVRVSTRFASPIGMDTWKRSIVSMLRRQVSQLAA